jgi:protein SCO1/2
MKKKLILLIISVFLILWYQLSKVDDEFQLPIFTPSDLRSTLVHPSLVGKTTHEIPNFSFVNQNGDIINQESVKNKYI